MHVRHIFGMQCHSRSVGADAPAFHPLNGIVIMDQQSHGKIKPCIIIIKMKPAKLGNGLDSVEQRMAVNEKTLGGSGNVAVFRQIDADRMDIVGAAVSVLVKQHRRAWFSRAKDAWLFWYKNRTF